MIAPATEPTTTPCALVADLLLARLLAPAKQTPAPSRVRADVARFFREPPSDDRWQEAVDGLVRAGLMTTRPLRLTDAGRARALDFVGVSQLPSRYNWGTIQAKLLLPKALGLAPTAQEVRRRVGRADGLAALLLKRKFDLAGGPSPALGEVVEALACLQLGFPGLTTLRDVRDLVLSRLLGPGERMKAKELRKQLPRKLLGATRGGLAGLRELVLREWADATVTPRGPAAPQVLGMAGPADGEPESAEFDLGSFAHTVRAAARDCPAGRFGDNKVFISHLWRHLGAEPGFPAMDLPAFKRRLAEANNAGLLTLSRADLVQVMDPVDVRESEARYLNAEFHFVLVEKEQP
jgi:hypothetical protein